MTRRPITEAEFLAAITGIDRSAFRLELQDAYAEPGEQGILTAYLATGGVDPTKAPGFPDWYALVHRLVTSGRRVERVRVHRDPPTDYQRFERHIGRWNAEAGEDIRYLARCRAADLGLPVGDLREWWLLDDERLIVLDFTADGRRIGTYLTDDPADVAHARTLRRIAWRHAAPAPRQQVA